MSNPPSAGPAGDAGPPPLPPLPSARKRGLRWRTVFLILPFLVPSILALLFLATRAPGGGPPAPGKTTAGVTYWNDRIPAVPWSIHIAKIDRTRKDLAYLAPHARNRVLGVSRLSEQARAIPSEVGHAIVGVNGDFYERDNATYAGDPRGLQILRGELISAPSTVCVWFDADNAPHLDSVKGQFSVEWPDGRKTPFGLNQQRHGNMCVLYTPTYGESTRGSDGTDLVLERAENSPWLPLRAGDTYRARVTAVRESKDTPILPGTMVLSLGAGTRGTAQEPAVGMVLEISTATTPDLRGVNTAIAGGPAIIQNGEPFTWMAPPPGVPPQYSERSKYERHPRSAIGWNATHVFLVTVDGRQGELSVGMKLAELAQYMKKLGCTEAMNFDGGASATMWMDGKVANNPCQGERAIANALVVVQTSVK